MPMLEFDNIWELFGYLIVIGILIWILDRANKNK